MTTKTYWLAFRTGDQYALSPFHCDSRQQAIHHGLEHVLDRELVAVFSENLTLTHDQMLELAPVLPPPCSAMWRPPNGDE